ncbi:MAG: dihydroorotate dehydrogenase [Chlamydiae bacterium CG10_big_fil_rev_8_21_14_0_10_42_34]|nr:MAG: dihydroorotate dehydrogenase [Chlamydiae bacterium CG10_big_fil_rev_8_21_14_0_10_42_34]
MIPKWFPKHPPLYDISKTYAENCSKGPFFSGEIPQRDPPKNRVDFLGHEVSSLIGVPAGPLLNSKWIELAGKLGFDIPVYKTIRSEAHPGHRLPNVQFIDALGNQITNPKTIDQLSITNSFGMPSQSPDFLLQDIERANRSLSEGQVMIVSVVGTPNRGLSFVSDFVKTAKLALEGGAKIIEANFSCPNVEKADGILYQNPQTVHEYTQIIAKAIHPIPLILKVGRFESAHQMKSVFLAAARGGAKAICGINSVSMQIHPPLDEQRKTSGVCGAAIRSFALEFVREGKKIVQENKLDLILIGCGGIIKPNHFNDFFDAGADVSMSAAGMMWDPYLAMRYHDSISHP